MSLGDRIRLARKRVGLNQTELASRLDITINTVNRYEKGHRLPDSDVLTHMVEIFGCDPGWLLTGKEPADTCDESDNVIAVENIPREHIIGWVREYWETASEKEKAWLETEFPRAFPEYKEWLQKKLDGDSRRNEGERLERAG